MKIEIQYHYYHEGRRMLTRRVAEEWVETYWFCPHCGEQSILKCTTNNDREQGDSYVCIACEHGFHWPYEPEKKGEKDAEILEGGWPQRFKQLGK